MVPCYGGDLPIRAMRPIGYFVRLLDRGGCRVLVWSSTCVKVIPNESSLGYRFPEKANDMKAATGLLENCLIDSIVACRREPLSLIYSDRGVTSHGSGGPA
jgi:hypothetical protein